MSPLSYEDYFKGLCYSIVLSNSQSSDSHASPEFARHYTSSDCHVVHEVHYHTRDSIIPDKRRKLALQARKLAFVHFLSVKINMFESYFSIASLEQPLTTSMPIDSVLEPVTAAVQLPSSVTRLLSRSRV